MILVKQKDIFCSGNLIIVENSISIESEEKNPILQPAKKIALLVFMLMRVDNLFAQAPQIGGPVPKHVWQL